MKHLAIILSLICLTLHAKGINPENTLKSANAFYSKNEYDKAIEQYKVIVDAGFVSKALYFNMGNAYFKTKNIKESILYYERAKLLDPADKDIDFNLNMAKSMTIDKIDSVPEVFFVVWLKTIQNLFSANAWAKFSILSLILSLIFWLVYLLSNKLIWKIIGFWSGILLVLVCICSFIFGNNLKNLQQETNKAIVFTPMVTAKSSPSDSGTNLFIVHEGTKIEIIDHVGIWSEIKISDGSRGWIKTSDFEII